MSTISEKPPSGRQYVAYLDLSGGLNTKRDSHALARNQLSISVNGWYSSGNALSKRPGSVPFANALGTPPGSTGTGTAGTGLGQGRYGGNTYALVQQGTAVHTAKKNDASFVSIGTVGGGTIRTAQMFDPDTTFNTVFIVDGVDTPQIWQGPGHSIAAANVTAGFIPGNLTNAAPITPKYVAVLGANQHLFFAGEPTAPNAVYISDPAFPTRFRTSSAQNSFYAGPYAPYFVGQNDGVNGGDITGLQQLGPSMLVFKETAVYRMDLISLYGDMVFDEQIVSSSVGCLSPLSLVAFDTFVCFLGIDGVYATDGYSTWCISANVPTLFDSTLSGFSAAITNRTTAVGVRSGNRYLMWFDTGFGVPNNGVSFDFNKPDENGLPTAGTITGMAVGGAAAFRNQNDDGNVCWIDPQQDRVGYFGLGFSDPQPNPATGFGAPIAVTFSGKADYMVEEFGQEAPLGVKVLYDDTLLVSAPQVGPGESLTFVCTIVTDLLEQNTASGSPVFISTVGGGLWGQPWGGFDWSATGFGTSQYVVMKIDGQSQAQGRIIQVVYQENSTFPWTVLGYILQLSYNHPRQ